MASGIRHGSSDRGVDALTRRRARASAAEIAETLRRRADHGLSPPVTGPLSGLTDVLVHGADMRIPLGLPHPAGSAACRPGARFPDESDAARLLPAPTPARYRITRRGHRANVGDGESIRGSGVAVMLAVCGRTVALDRLAGPGLPVLQSRRT
jgi:hypothetical protein